MKSATFFLVAILIIAHIMDSKLSNDLDDTTTKDLLEAMKDISEDISNSIKNGMSRGTSRPIVCIVKEAKITLPKVEKKAISLIDLVDQKLNEADKEIDASIEGQQNELATWGDEEAQKGDDASDEQITQINLLITNLLESFQNDSQACADKTMKPIKKLYDQTVEAVEGSFPMIRSLSEKIDSCVRLNQKTHRLTTKCATEVQRNLKPISALHGKYSKLFNQVKAVNIKNYDRAPCAVDIVNKFKTQKSDVSKDITNIMDGTYDGSKLETAASGKTEKGKSKAARDKMGVQLILQHINVKISQ